MGLITATADASDTTRFLRWCRAIKAGRSTFETIPFYKLSSYLTQFGMEMDYPPEDFGSSDSAKPLYYQDDYSRLPLTTNSRIDTVNDRFRLEYLPILDRLKHLKKIVERMNSQNPEFIPSPLQQTQQRLGYFDRIGKVYLGSQITIPQMISDCHIEAHNESWRRMRAVIDFEKFYQEEFVFPLFSNLASGSITLGEANFQLRLSMRHQKGFTDHFIKRQDGGFSYIINHTSYILRVRQWLQGGLAEIKNANGVKISRSAILGNQMTIPIPINFLTDSENPYVSSIRTRSRKVFTFNNNWTKETYAQQVVSSLSDRLRLTGSGEGDQDPRLDLARFTSWDLSGASKFSQHAPFYISHYVFYTNWNKWNTQTLNCAVAEIGQHHCLMNVQLRDKSL